MIVEVFEGSWYEYLFVAPGRSDIEAPDGWKPIGVRDTRSFPGAGEIENSVKERGFWQGAFCTFPAPPR